MSVLSYTFYVFKIPISEIGENSSDLKKYISSTEFCSNTLMEKTFHEISLLEIKVNVALEIVGIYLKFIRAIWIFNLGN